MFNRSNRHPNDTNTVFDPVSLIERMGKATVLGAMIEKPQFEAAKEIGKTNPYHYATGRTPDDLACELLQDGKRLTTIVGLCQGVREGLMALGSLPHDIDKGWVQ